MKKLVAVLILLLIVLSACVNREASNPIEPNENNMVINFKNHADFDFYGLELAILNQTSGSVNADGSKIDKGDLISFEFLEEDFTLEGEAEMEVRIIKNNQGDVIPIKKSIIIELANNKGIFFEITGDSPEDAEIREL